MHFSHSKWIHGAIELPCLSKGLDPNAGPWAYRGDEHTFSPIDTPNGIWYYDNHGIRVVDKGADFVHLETIFLKNEISHRIKLEDITAPLLMYLRIKANTFRDLSSARVAPSSFRESILIRLST